MQCPENEAGWLASIQQLEEHVGWQCDDNPLANDVHKLFLLGAPLTLIPRPALGGCSMTVARIIAGMVLLLPAILEVVPVDRQRR